MRRLAGSFLAVLVLIGPTVRAQTASPPQDVKESGTDVPPPKRTKMTPPTYPPEAQAQGIRGIVIIEIVIGTDGKVLSADIVRSIAGLDEAALSAVKSWEYEVTKVDGKPVPVRLRVPITFALRLPSIDRQEGVPELRAGVLPAIPEGASASGEVKAQITVDPDGRVSDASVTQGPPALAEAVVRALNTWRFAPDPDGATVECRLIALFDPGAKENKVSVRLESPQKSQTLAQAAPAPKTPPSDAPAPPATTPAPGSLPSPGEQPSPAATPTPATLPPAIGAPGTQPPASPAPAAPSPAPSEAPASPPAAAPAPTPSAAAPTPAPDASPAAAPRSAQPPIEVISQAPQTSLPTTAPSAPPEQGFSSIRDVSLGAGVPDLVKGRRPVIPPIARIEGATGNVRVDFTIDAAGQTSVLRTEGVELLKTAAQQAVQSWSFRRTRPERIAMTAEFVYTAEGATAAIKPTP